MASTLQAKKSRPTAITLMDSGLGFRARLNQAITMDHLVLLFALGLGLTVRLLPVIASPFPTGDGGMFYVMVHDLQANHFHLPAFTSFNHERIPFAYPPLAFYVIGILQRCTGIDLLQIFRIFPVIVDTLGIVAFALLARRILESRIAWTGAVITFALLPDGYYQQIKGGGITRSLGMTFALLAMWRVAILLQDRQPRHVFPAALCAAVAVASHPEWTWALAVGSGVLWVAYGRDLRSLFFGTVVLLVTIGCTSPWWLTVLKLHGPTPFLAVLGGSTPASVYIADLVQLFSFTVENGIFFSVISTVALAGVVRTVVLRQWLLPGWLLAFTLLAMHGGTGSRGIPLALLAGVGLKEVILPMLQRRQARGTHSIPTERMCIAMLVLLVLRALLESATLSYANSALDSPTLAAMAWTRHHAASNARFLVINGAPWAANDPAEWFPALTGRRSVDTIQGLEWVRGAFAQGFLRDESIQSCASRGPACIDLWQRATGVHFDYLFVGKGVPPQTGLWNHWDTRDYTWTLRALLAPDRHYRMVFSNHSAVIYRLEP